MTPRAVPEHVIILVADKNIEHALRTVRLPRSAALYRQLAQQVSLTRCTDASFLKFKVTLQKWFAE